MDFYDDSDVEYLPSDNDDDADDNVEAEAEQEEDACVVVDEEDEDDEVLPFDTVETVEPVPQSSSLASAAQAHRQHHNSLSGGAHPARDYAVSYIWLRLRPTSDFSDSLADRADRRYE